ncbi:MAG TPA: BatA domain-containing protein [Planctomycetaceae bacterium]|nr:BatA domain-containing protein [Planctomycetaceae bacterium]
MVHLPQLPLPLAFGFASPWLLGALALGGIPILVHLLHKRKFKVTDWAAMRFLLEAARKNDRRIRLEQLILLAVRVLILVLLVLALARPYVETFGTVFQADAPRHRILVVDASFSMGFRPAEFSRFDRARATARQIVSEASPGDAFNLARIAGLPPQILVRQVAHEPGLVIDEIDRLVLTDERGDIPATLEQLVELAAREATEIPQKEVYIISDFQRESWAPSSSVERARLRDLLGKLAERARVMLIDVADPQSPNAAVTSFTMDEPYVTVGREIELHAALRLFGGSLAREQAVELYANGRLAATQKVRLAPGIEAPVTFTHTFSEPGEHRLEVRAAGDALAADNQRWLAVPVRRELNVLLVNGRAAGRPADAATHYLETALAPSTRRQRWEGITQPRVVTDGELAATDLSLYDCVFLVNVGRLTQREADILDAYVQSGGGLVIVPGDQLNADNYNQQLHRDGEGLLPVRLGDRRGNARDPSPAERDVFSFSQQTLDHPIVRKFEGNPAAGLANTLVLEYVTAQIPPDSQARVAVSYLETGDPAIITAPVGRGQVIVYTTSADNRWGPWPLQASFTPIVHETVRFAVSGRWTERQLEVGEPLIRAFSTRAFDLEASVRHPDGSHHAVRVADSDAFARLNYDRTERSGLYEVRLGPPLNHSEWFGVNVDSRESDLARTTADELQTELLKGIPLTYRTGWQEFDAAANGTGQERGLLTKWFLWAVLCLIFVEQLMAWRFLPGFVVLCGLVVLTLVGQTFAASTVGGVLLIAAAGAAAGVTWFVRRSRGRAAPSRA